MRPFEVNPPTFSPEQVKGIRLRALREIEGILLRYESFYQIKDGPSTATSLHDRYVAYERWLGDVVARKTVLPGVSSALFEQETVRAIRFYEVLSSISSKKALSQELLDALPEIALRTREYCAEVDYDTEIRREALLESFSDVALWWDEARYDIEDHPTREGEQHQEREKIFYLKRFDQGMRLGDVVKWARENGYKLATLKEAIAFGRTYRAPAVVRTHIVVLGSSYVEEPSTRWVPCLKLIDGKYALDDTLARLLFPVATSSFLLVRDP